jgi:WD40 repeat protein
VALLACCALGIALLAVFALVGGWRVNDQPASSSQSTPTTATNAPVAADFHHARTLESAGVLYMAWSSDGRTLATGQGNSVELWEPSSGQLLGIMNVYAVSSLVWSPGSLNAKQDLLAVGDTSNSIRVFDAQAGEELHPRPSNMAATPGEDAVWSPDGRLIASRFVDQPQNASTTPLPPAPMPMPQAPGTFSPTYGAVRLWEPLSGNTVRVIRMPHKQEWDAGVGSLPVFKVAWSSDGRYLATYSQYTDVRVWDPATGNLLHSFTLDGMRPLDETKPELAWQPGGHTLAVIRGRTIELWDASQDAGTLLHSLPDAPPPPPPVPTAVPTMFDPLHPAPPPVPPAVPTNAEGLPITPLPMSTFPSPTPRPTYVYKDQGYQAIRGIAWSPGGALLASFDGHHIRVWDPATGRQVRRMRTASEVVKIAWSPDGSLLASLDGEVSKSPPIFTMYVNQQPAFYDGTLRLWDPITGNELQSVRPGQVSDFEWSPNGSKIAVRTGISASIWSADGTIAAPNEGLTPTPTTQPGATATAGISSGAVCGAWSVVPVPAINAQESELRSVAALGNAAWAVGYSSNSKRDAATGQMRDARTLIVHWSDAAGAWEHVPSPNFGSGDNVLNGVATISNRETNAIEVWAVGYYAGPNSERRALALRWDGKTWQQTPIPGVSDVDSALNAVSGSAGSDVWAVGTLGGRHTLTLHWDGTRWSRMPSPSPGVELNELTSVYAKSPGEAWAAGKYLYLGMPIGAPQGDPLVLRWDGSRWRPVPVQFGGTYVNAVSIAPGGEGWLAGGYAGEGGGSGALSRLRDGRGEIVPFPQIELSANVQGQSNVPDSNLNGVAAPASDDAWVVGHFSTDGYGPTSEWQGHTLTLHWDGTAWSRVPSPDAGTQGNALNAVAASPGHVWAVGRSGPYESPQALIIRFDGPWCSTPTATSTQGANVPPAGSPSPGGSSSPSATQPPAASASSTSPASTQQQACAPAWRALPDDNAGMLTSVAILPDGLAWAAGRTDGFPARTLIKRWDGARWVQVPSPGVDSYDNILYGIAASSADDAWAVGAYYTPSSTGLLPGNSLPLLLHWDGVAWRIMPTPDLGSTWGGTLQAVTAISSDAVWAVGSRRSLDTEPGKERVETLIEHWDGKTWSIALSPNPGKVASNLHSVSGTSHEDVWAVGSFSEGGSQFAGDTKTLVLHWNGREWAHVPSPGVDAWVTSLSGVVAISKDDAWAVGVTNGGEHTDPLAMHWDGERWTLVPPPESTSHNGGWLSGVAAVSPDDVWAVGGDNPVTLIEHWDGKSWSEVRIEPTVQSGDVLFGSLAAVAVLSPSEALAVGGGYAGSAGGSALTLRWSDDDDCVAPTD